MMGFFDDAVKPVGLLEHKSDATRKLTVAGFEKSSTPVALLWYSDQIPNDELAWDRVRVTVKGAAFKNPVYVEMITGKVYDLDKSTWKSVGGDTTFEQLPMWTARSCSPSEIRSSCAKTRDRELSSQ